MDASNSNSISKDANSSRDARNRSTNITRVFVEIHEKLVRMAKNSGKKTKLTFFA